MTSLCVVYVLHTSCSLWAYNSWRVSPFNSPTRSAFYISSRSFTETSLPETARTFSSVCFNTVLYADRAFCGLISEHNDYFLQTCPFVREKVHPRRNPGCAYV